MEESRISVTDRLRASGEWQAASSFKDAKVKEYRAAGLSRSEAGDRAWKAMCVMYPPHVFQPGRVASVDYDPDMAGADFLGGVNWVYAAINTDASVDDAPDPGAAGLLEWARDNRDAFYRQIVPKALEIKAKQGGGDVDAEAMEEQIECESIAELLGVID